jgi:succinate-semialdehyde dehydrogenase / glutarate-semialdehyde dehydrogenase
MIYQSINPYTHELLKSFPLHSDKALEIIVNHAQTAFHDWRKSTFAVRTIHLLSLADLMMAHKQELATLISLEMGKNINESLAEIQKCVDCCEFYAENTDLFLKRDRLIVPDGVAYVEFQPLGAILGIMPWNFPFWQVFRFAIPAIMAGNVVLLKHAPNVPHCALRIESLFKEAGFPEGVFQQVFADEAQIQQLLAHEAIRGLSFTGSENAGRTLYAQAAQHIKKVVLELGGSDPFLVFADTDIKATAQSGAYARMLNSGQSCIAAKRFIVEQSVAIPLLDQFINAINDFKWGDPMDKAVHFGCMARRDLVEQVHRQVQESVSMGAKVLIGGNINQDNPIFYQPTIIVDVTDEMPIWREEVFGPVAVIRFADNEDAMIQLANDSSYGLGASVWTKDLNKAARVALKIASGSVYINRIMASHPAVPFGGIKNSGIGNELSEQGILEFVNQKVIWRA